MGVGQEWQYIFKGMVLAAPGPDLLIPLRVLRAAWKLREPMRRVRAPGLQARAAACRPGAPTGRATHFPPGQEV